LTNKYFEQIREAQVGNKLGGTYIEANEMLSAIMTWADFNFDDWLDVADTIGDVKLSDMRRLLEARIKQNEGYYKVANGQYARNKLVDFVNKV
jgi:hypothetical protein